MEEPVGCFETNPVALKQNVLMLTEREGDENEIKDSFQMVSYTWSYRGGTNGCHEF
jgi:5-methylcytosine-specific restriction endonuclease McrBC regulatory subunit McrC